MGYLKNNLLIQLLLPLQGSRSKIILILTFSLLTVFWGVIIGYAVVMSMPYSAINTLPLDTKRNRIFFRTILPEGFSFFTRDPRELQAELYKIREGVIIPYSRKNSTFKNLFGVIKKSRAQNLELGYLLSQIKINDWSKCSGNIDDCRKKTLTNIILQNNFKYPLLCGRFIIVIREPVPWAWANGVSRDKLVGDFVEINIECD